MFARIKIMVTSPGEVLVEGVIKILELVAATGSEDGEFWVDFLGSFAINWSPPHQQQLETTTTTRKKLGDSGGAHEVFFMRIRKKSDGKSDSCENPVENEVEKIQCLPRNMGWFGKSTKLQRMKIPLGLGLTLVEAKSFRLEMEASKKHQILCFHVWVLFYCENGWWTILLDIWYKISSCSMFILGIIIPNESLCLRHIGWFFVLPVFQYVRILRSYDLGVSLK